MSAEPLAQGGLFEPEPPRSVVSAGRGWWGVDPSTRKYAVATVDMELRRRVHQVLLGEKGTMNGERMTRYAIQMRLLISAMLAEGCPEPAAVWVEQASGKHQKPELVYNVAIATQVMHEELNRLLGYRVLVETVPSGTWKSAGLGNGRISKNDPETGKPWRPPDRYPVLQWAKMNGYEGEDWDHADAMGIAEGLRKTVGIRAMA